MTDGSSLKDYTILIVDDDLVFLEMVEGLLEMIGVRNVMRASSGAFAIEAIKESQRVIDCVICDCRMHDVNGLQLLKDVRMGGFKQLRPDSCFILLTSATEPEIVKIAKQLDVSGYLLKPVTVEKLEAAITKARARVFPLDFRKYGAVLVPSAL